MKYHFVKHTLHLIILSLFIISLIHHSNVYVETFSKNTRSITVIIDAGHGSPDSGAISANGTKEKDLNLIIAKKLEKKLNEKGFKVIMTRKNDFSLSKSKTNNKREDLNKRKHLRDNSNADIMISIHMNHFNDPIYSGAQVFYNDGNESNAILAENIQNNIIEIADPDNTRSIKCDNNIFILKDSKTPSVLVECGFLSNNEEAKKLCDSDYQNKIAHAIYCGLIDYLKIIYKS